MPPTASGEETLRKGLAASAVLVGLLVAGCGSGTGQPSPGTTGAPPPPASSDNQPKRNAPAKSLQVANKCAIVSDAQSRALGADQPPAEEESNGKQGCTYQLGKAGSPTGWGVFVAADPTKPLAKFVAERPSQAKRLEVAGYPAAEVKVGQSNCLLALDVADQGSLFVNSLTRGNFDACQQAQKLAEAAVKNLPNA
jgi:hypothetical protein